MPYTSYCLCNRRKGNEGIASFLLNPWSTNMYVLNVGRRYDQAALLAQHHGPSRSRGDNAENTQPFFYLSLI